MSPLFYDAPTDQAGPGVVARASGAVELEWVLSSAEREDFRRDHPVLWAAYAARPGLDDRVRALWADDEAVSCGGFMELLILAHHGNLLFAPAPEVLGSLEDLCRRAPALDHDSYPLMSETGPDRTALGRRLRRLRSSARLRRRYVEVLAEAWEQVAAEWSSHGEREVAAAVAVLERSIARGADWAELTKATTHFGDLLPRAIAAMGPGGAVAVVPAYFTHRGLLMDLPGVVVVGVRTDSVGGDVRARTEVLARRLRAVSDPTRLAIIETLRRRPSTVGQLAATFALAQPTVSNHVKVLRAAGLVLEARRGGSRLLSIDTAAGEELLSGLGGVLGAGAS